MHLDFHAFIFFFANLTTTKFLTACTNPFTEKNEDSVV